MRDLAMVPGYQAIHGRPCALNDLIGLIKQFARDDWLLHLSRLATLLAGYRHRPGEYADVFFHCIVPDSVRPKLASWFGQATQQGNRALIFPDRDVGILIELALLHAPRQTTKELGPEGQVLDALLMLTDLARPPQLPQSEEGWAAVLASLWERSYLVDPISTTARGFFLYQIACEEPSQKARDWANLFERATAAELKRYFLGGLAAFAVEFLKSPDEIARSFTPLPDTLTDDKGIRFHGVPEDYYALRCATVEEITREVARLETHADPNEFSLVPLLNWPFAGFEDTAGGWGKQGR